MAVQTKILHRRDTLAAWVAANPSLDEGELGFVIHNTAGGADNTKVGYFKIGRKNSGGTLIAWNDLEYENLQGDKGDAATIAVGTVGTGAAGSSVAVTNVGTSNAATFNFTIPKGDKGDTGTAATIAVGSVTTGAAGSSATVINAGTSGAATFNFSIPRGATGTAATLTLGTVTTGAAGSSAAITNSGTSSAATFNFTIPKGDKGDAATIAVGTVTTGAAGSSATVTNTGTTAAANFDFSIPRGATGFTGATGAGFAGITSTTSNALTTGSKTWSVASTGALVVGDRVRVINTTTKFAEGTITSLSANASITVLVDVVVGTGTYTSWTVSLAGLKGDAATIALGTVATGIAGSSVIITNSGTADAATFNFTIPKGDKGDTGTKGDTGDIGVTGPGYASTTSTTANSISTGSKTFTVTNTGAFAVGNRVRVINTGTISNNMEGSITSLTANTSVTVNVDRISGSGTISSWTFALAGEVGATGATGTSLTTGGNRIYVSSTQPATPSGGWVVGDVWIQI
jgi:hypothetical protein